MGKAQAFLNDEAEYQLNYYEKCNYKSGHEQFNVYHVGHLNNTLRSNLKTICANCQRTMREPGRKVVPRRLLSSSQ